jgi:hypothetical protein
MYTVSRNNAKEGNLIYNLLYTILQAPDGHIIKMTIDELHMAYNPDTLRCYHWLEIQYNLPGQPGVR